MKGKKILQLLKKLRLMKKQADERGERMSKNQ